MTASQIVYVVDDELQVQRSLRFLLATAGYAAEVYSSAEQFLERFDARRAGCLLLDLRMSGESGVELQARLRAADVRLPVILMSGCADTPSVVQAMRGGAIDFLEKPFADDLLLDRLAEAFAKLHVGQQNEERRASIAERLSSLSPREREVLELLVEGKSTKQIASQLEISPKTVDVHRTRVLQKMEVENLVQLVSLVRDGQ